jgi:IMP dehydrogenase/GMP reductase
MAGNVATAEAFRDLSEWGANSVRVGIGGGSICSTRIQTGHGIPTFQSVLDCVPVASEYNVALIADGGIRTSGDIVKLLAAGADAVMCGSLLGGTEEAPGKTLEDPDGRLWKVYRGMASKEAQVDWKGTYNSYEGVTSRIPCRGPVKNVLADLERGIRSGFSYSGARDLTDLYVLSKVYLPNICRTYRKPNPHCKQEVVMADNYGQMEKRVVFMENDHRHAQMVLKLKYLRLTQAAFFRHVITGLINDDPRIVEFTNEIALTSKTKRDKAEKTQREGQQNSKRLWSLRGMMLKISLI